MKLILFDIDGTLLLTGPSPGLAFSKAFSELFGMKNAWGDTKAHGKTDPLIISEIACSTLGRELSEKEYRDLCKRYVELFRTTIIKDKRFHVLPGVEALLKRLRDTPGLELGIETGNFKSSAQIKLRHGGLAEYFSFGGYASDSGQREEIIEAAIGRGRKLFGGNSSNANGVVVIGDAPQDIAAARAQGAAVIAVATGRSSLDELAKLSPDYLLEDLSETSKVVDILAA